MKNRVILTFNKMKTTRILFFMMLVSASYFSQEASYDGPAKMYVNNFNRDLESAKVSKSKGAMVAIQTKISQLEKGITNIKSKDPAYNTSVMESELASLKEFYEANKDNQKKAMEAQHNSQWSDVNLKKDLDYLFKEANLQVGHNNIDLAQKRLDDFKAKTESVLSKASTAPQDYVKYISKFNGTMPQFYDRNKALLADINNVEEYKPAFFELQLYEAYWDAAQKIYPEQTEFKEAHAKIVAYKKSVGGLKDVEKVSEKNSIEKIKNNKMDAPLAKDPALEKFVLDAFNATFKNDYGAALKVVLTQNGWTTERNQLTSAITGRNRTTQVAYKGKDGKCYLLSGVVYIYEEYIGDKFTNRVIVYKGLGGTEMLCENIK